GDASTIWGAAQPVAGALQTGIAPLGGERQAALNGTARRPRTLHGCPLERTVAGDCHVVGKIGDEDFGEPAAPVIDDVPLEGEGAALPRTVRFQVAVLADPPLLERLLDFVRSGPGMSHGPRHQHGKIADVVVARM